MAGLLARPPGQETLDLLAASAGAEGAFGKAVGALAAAAAEATPKSVAEEYQDLFIGLGRGELVPFASYYLTGFLNEKPLAALRGDLRRLGAARDPAIKEPEDHIAFIMEVMAGLITGRFGGASLGLDEQQRFYDQHLASWATHFFRDLETAKTSIFYRPVGRIGRLLMEIESEAFAMTG
ncbi:MAG: molecular chaperone TorD family protein [Kiloniellales bacterium]